MSRLHWLSEVRMWEFMDCFSATWHHTLYKHRGFCMITIGVTDGGRLRCPQKVRQDKMVQKQDGELFKKCIKTDATEPGTYSTHSSSFSKPDAYNTYTSN